MQTTHLQESGRRTSTNLPRLSITACLRCRDQKLKCGREHPICTRCDRLNATCVYPDPPNRRGPRAKRRQRLPLQTAERSRDGSQSGHVAIQQTRNNSALPDLSPTVEQTSSSHHVNQSITANPSGPFYHSRGSIATPTQTQIGKEAPDFSTDFFTAYESYAAQLCKMKTVAIDSAADSTQPPLPPTALGLSLLEVYFTRVYNASLLFYKPLLFQQYLEGKIHSVLIRALFALATLFLHPIDNENEQNTNTELKILRIYRPCGLSWAKSALEEVMSLAMHSPSLMAVQALECIQLFWFGIGQPHPGNLCLALAYRSCKILGYDRRPADENDSCTSLEAELGRRCFWACWISTCIVMQPEPYIESAWKEAAMLPLPCLVSGSFNQMMDKDWNALPVRNLSENLYPPTTSGLLIKIIGIWAKVQLHCKAYVNRAHSGLNSLRQLSQLATSIFDDAAEVRTSAYQGDQTTESQMMLFLHDSVYHQIQIALHSTIVPLFSGIPADEKIDTETRRSAAQTVIHHADQFECLLGPHLYDKQDVSRIPPLVGYGAFVVGIIFLSTEVRYHTQPASELPFNTSRKDRRLATVHAILHLLDTIKAYWRALQYPAEVLRSALEAAHLALSKPPRLIDSGNDELLRHTNDNHQSLPAEGLSTTIDSANGHLQSPMPDTNEEDYAENTRPLNISDESNELDILPDGYLTSQMDEGLDFEWYDVSFAEVGVEGFEGLEASNLFRQGWKSFS
ncbi:putative transcriptional regulatory protein [Fusarium oxysporum f. sp. cubense]|uniref:Putative transcriptional regulatory protein n=1 Tax=Fusarium oxysporum f. sp. cubense TaxID=61366 RepID=A0A559LX08_FUSOC|nr:putative transcriptional regulatory protein [Fusarium oxysporum f. sp. cubense]